MLCCFQNSEKKTNQAIFFCFGNQLAKQFFHSSKAKAKSCSSLILPCREKNVRTRRKSIGFLIFSIDVSIKTSLYHNAKRIGKQTTTIQRKQKHPVFNESFHFDVSRERVDACDLLFEVRHHGPVHRSVIGYVHVGSGAEGAGNEQWKQLLDFAHFEKVSHRIVPTKPLMLVA